MRVWAFRVSGVGIVVRVGGRGSACRALDRALAFRVAGVGLRMHVGVWGGAGPWIRVGRVVKCAFCCCWRAFPVADVGDGGMGGVPRVCFRGRGVARHRFAWQAQVVGETLNLVACARIRVCVCLLCVAGAGNRPEQILHQPAEFGAFKLSAVEVGCFSDLQGNGPFFIYLCVVFPGFKAHSPFSAERLGSASHMRPTPMRPLHRQAPCKTCTEYKQLRLVSGPTCLSFFLSKKCLRNVFFQLGFEIIEYPFHFQQLKSCEPNCPSGQKNTMYLWANKSNMRAGLRKTKLFWPLLLF